eukprot:6466557-Amphidinium_carterae.1
MFRTSQKHPNTQRTLAHTHTHTHSDTLKEGSYECFKRKCPRVALLPKRPRRQKPTSDRSLPGSVSTLGLLRGPELYESGVLESLRCSCDMVSCRFTQKLEADL